ncbi:MAG: enoyl-CoA hydratase-related protein [bacterium]
MSNENAPLLVRREPPLAWVIVNRPAARNAMNAAVWDGLADAAEQLAADAEVRVVIVRGAGEQAFISGADISEFRALRADATATAAADARSARAWRGLQAMPQPVMAMIYGFCFGGGVAVALACDVRFAADDARFAVPAARLGLSYPFESLERLVRVVGPTHAADILLSARTLSASEAHQVGFVNRLVPAADLERVTREYALTMAAGAPLTLAALERAIHAVLQSEQVRELARRCFDSADYQEGIAAFLEKRPARFEGR